MLQLSGIWGIRTQIIDFKGFQKKDSISYVFLPISNMLTAKLIQSNFFQNEEIFVQLDELDEMDRITHKMR